MRKEIRKDGIRNKEEGNSVFGKTFATLTVLLFFTQILFAQHVSDLKVPQQQLRGVVTDQVLQSPVSGATVTISGLKKSVITDQNGAFRFNQVPVGIYQLVISYVGYREVVLDNINLNSGKEMVLTISMESRVQSEEAIIVKINSRKNKPLNEMSTVSARAFSVEETQKYAAAVNDPLRMATGFPG